mgnify:CR=1 FL=1
MYADHAFTAAPGTAIGDCVSGSTVTVGGSAPGLPDQQQMDMPLIGALPPLDYEVPGLWRTSWLDSDSDAGTETE